MWNSAIYDRTQLDLLLRTQKAFLNVSDWLRITGNTEQIQAVVRVFLALDIPLTPITPPTLTTWPKVEDINQLIENIDALREAACLPVSAGVIPLKHDYLAGNGSVAPDYNAVNAWERDLFLIRAQLAAASDYRVSCGVANCGQPRFFQSRFRAYPAYVPVAASPVRVPRCGLALAGSSLTQQNSFRRY
jgi:hypothetical protein